MLWIKKRHRGLFQKSYLPNQHIRHNEGRGKRLKSKLSCTLVLLLLVSMFVACSNFQSAKVGTSSQTASRQPASSISWMPGKRLPVTNGRVVFPPLPPQEPVANYYTHWYAGSIYPSLLPAQNASTINMSITIPPSEPRPEQFYYVILSAFDSNGSYDQIGFCAYYGVWGLSYSWTVGSPYPASNVVYYYDPAAMILSLGATYTFSITTQAGVTDFVAYQGSRMVWSLAVSTGGDYLVVSNYCAAGKRAAPPYDYTDYEEVYYTSTPNGAPDFNFNFCNNTWLSTHGTLHNAIWTPWYSPDQPQIPNNVQVVVNSNSALVENPGTWWPTFHHDLWHNGYSTSTAPVATKLYGHTRLVTTRSPVHLWVVASSMWVRVTTMFML